MNNLNESKRAFFRTMKDSPELEQHGFRLLLQREDFPNFFDVLVAEEFFAPNRNPSPQESGDLVAVPYWPPLEYLRRCAERASQDDDIELAERVMTIVRDVSAADEGSLQRNSHTADAFAEIIGLLPRSAVHLRDLRLIPRWLRIPFSTGRIAHVLDSGALSSFLSSDSEEDWLKALEILRHCTVFRWDRDPPHAAVPIVDVYSLERLIERHASVFGRKLGTRALNLFEERVSEVFSREERKRRSDVIRPAIEEHEQNRSSMPLENCLVLGIRDALLAWCTTRPSDATAYVGGLLVSDSQILRRIGIHVLDQRWDDLRTVYATVLGPQLFDHGHLHELYALLRRHFSSLSEGLKAQTLEAIRTLSAPDDDYLVGNRELVQLRWLQALEASGYEPAMDFHDALRKTTNAAEVEHPDFRIYTETRWGPGPSPYDVADLLGFVQSGVIAQRLNDCRSVRGQGPSPEGLVAALERAVTEAPTTFLEALPQMLEARAEYQCGMLHALRHLWEQSEGSGGRLSWGSAWPRVFGFFG